jgi:hypothetical protein
MKQTLRPQPRKLTLAADVVRHLRTVDPGDLRRVHGGIDDQTRSCDAIDHGALGRIGG